MSADKERYRVVIPPDEIAEILATEDEFQRWCRRRARERQADAPRNLEGDTLDSFMGQLGKISTVTSDEVTYLSKRIHAGLNAADSIAEGETDEDLERLVRIGKQARQELIIANIPLVFSLARRFNHGDTPYVDIIQAGITGLMVCINRFDYTKDFLFSTYAAYWIQSSFQRAVEKEKDGTFCLTRTSSTRLRRMQYLQLQAIEKNTPMPTRAELAKDLGTTEDKIAELELVSAIPASLDTRLFDTEDSPTVADTIVGDEDIEVIFEDEDIEEDIRRVLKCLNHTEHYIVRHHYGILGADVMSTEEIGECVGLTPGSVRTYLGTALAKLRRDRRCKDLAGYFGGFPTTNI